MRALDGDEFPMKFLPQLLSPYRLRFAGSLKCFYSGELFLGRFDPSGKDLGAGNGDTCADLTPDLLWQSREIDALWAWSIREDYPRHSSPTLPARRFANLSIYIT